MDHFLYWNITIVSGVDIYQCMKKMCPNCKSSNNSFSPDPKSSDGLRSWCKVCMNNYNRETYHRGKGKVYRQKRWENHSTYNVNDYITATCPLCDKVFFPTMKTNIYCSLCHDAAKLMRQSLQRNTSPVSEDDLTKIGKRYIQSMGCCYCHQQYSKSNPKSFDHIVPKCKGGLSTNENVSICCLRCNRSKGDLSTSEWFDHCKLVLNYESVAATGSA